MAVPTHLRVEHVDEPMGLTIAAPRLSWRLPFGAKTQAAYRVRAGQWDSGRVESEQSLLVPYSGPAVSSEERVDWTVKVWTDAGESEWAEPAWWEAGLLDPSDWSARWIEPVVTDDVHEQDPPPAWHLRGSLTLAGPFEQARLHVTAHGVYEFFVNGRRVGDMELTPGFTSYQTALQVQTFDITDLLVTGENVVGAVLSGGWLKWTSRYRHLSLGLLAQINVSGRDGSLARYGTGADWLATVGSIQSSDLQQGQVVDLRRGVGSWWTAGADLAAWTPVRVVDVDVSRLRSSPAPPVRRVEEIRPVAVTRPAPDRQVVDLGQNINGWTRLVNLGPADTTVTLTHGEALDASGDVSVDHLTGMPTDRTESFQRDQVTSAGRPGEVFEPRHVTHGFRYVRVEGHLEDLNADDLTGVVVHTDLRRAGWFECSDERVNRLHEAVVWSFRGNACDIPTDCPTRERAGWTGDWQLFVPCAAFLYDVAGFSVKWLKDLAADQEWDGVVPYCAPNHQRFELHPAGSAGWGDAAVIVPWEIYKAYGDCDLLAQQWPSMTAWVGYAARMAREHRHPSRTARRADPEPHEEFLWDTGFHWGEWLEPDMPLGTDGIAAFVDELSTIDHGNTATAYLHRSAGTLAKIAAILGRPDAGLHYRALAVAARAAWQREFLRPDGTVVPQTQANYVRALMFRLVPDDLRHAVSEKLVALIRAANMHLGTGFLATPYLLPVLAETGHLDVAYELLFQDTEPSWLTMLGRGATTMWEHWTVLDGNGLPTGPSGVGSLNHYSKGAVASFLHYYIAGIQLQESAPAYRRFRIAPQPGGGLTWARAVHDCPYGRIESSWRIDGDWFVLDVEIPGGTSAEICLPDGSTTEAHPGTSRYECPARGAVERIRFSESAFSTD